jgi:hypothetical protein
VLEDGGSKSDEVTIALSSCAREIQTKANGNFFVVLSKQQENVRVKCDDESGGEIWRFIDEGG